MKFTSDAQRKAVFSRMSQMRACFGRKRPGVDLFTEKELDECEIDELLNKIYALQAKTELINRQNLKREREEAERKYKPGIEFTLDELLSNDNTIDKSSAIDWNDISAFFDPLGKFPLDEFTLDKFPLDEFTLDKFPLDEFTLDKFPSIIDRNDILEFLNAKWRNKRRY